MALSYKDLEIYQLAHRLAVEIHKMTLTLPSFEMYEEASQIRRSSKSVSSCIVEGYGRRRYKSDFIRFLVFAQASNDETREHLDLLNETGSLKDQEQYRYFVSSYEELLRNSGQQSAVSGQLDTRRTSEKSKDATVSFMNDSEGKRRSEPSNLTLSCFLDLAS